MPYNKEYLTELIFKNLKNYKSLKLNLKKKEFIEFIEFLINQN